MNTLGRHLLAEYSGCDAAVLNDLKQVEALMCAAARAAQTTVVASVFHPFAPQGVSGVVVIEESHLSIHTWPEHGYAAIDFYTCGEAAPELAHEFLREALGATHAELMLVDRGMAGPADSLGLRYHRKEGLHGRAASEPPSRSFNGAVSAQ